MKTQTDNFAISNAATNIEPRYVAAISFSDPAEKPLQNLVTYSEQLDNAAWVTSPAGATPTVTANTTAAPDGTTTADTIADNNTPFPSAQGKQQNYTMKTREAKYRVSVFVKKDTTGRATRFPELQIVFQIGGTTETNTCGIDTATGEFKIINAASVEVEASVDNYSAAWWRLNLWARPLDTLNTLATLRVRPAAGASATWAEGSATGSAIFWGMQLAIALADNDYIKTEATVEEGGAALVYTNIFSKSSEIDHADWTKSLLTVTANDAVAPDGTTTADKLEDASAGGFSYGYQEVTLNNITKYFYSAFIKKDATGRATRFAALSLNFVESTTNEVNAIYIDTSTGEFNLINDDAGGAGDPAIAGGVIDHDGDYWRCWVSARPQVITRDTIRAFIYPAFGSGAGWTKSSLVQGAIHAWGFQVSESASLIRYYATDDGNAVSIQSSDVDEYYLTTHADAELPADVWSWDRLDNSIIDITGQTQRVIPDRAQHTIGNIKIRLLDIDAALTERIRERLVTGEGLRYKRVRLYKGFGDLNSWDDYALRFTYLIDDVTYLNGVYTLVCSDVQRTEKTEIFDAHQGVLTSTITSTAASIPITIAGAAEKFPLLEHDSNYQSDADKTVGYIQIDEEIIRHLGWNAGKTELTVDTGGRGALNTAAAVHTVTASTDDQKKKVVEYIYIEMNTPRLIYAVLTGKIENQFGNMPAHWSLGISTDFVRRSDFVGIGPDLWEPISDAGRMAKFQGLERVTAKSFIEKELLLWCGAFTPVYADGALGLKKFQNILPRSSYTAHLREWDIVSYGALQHDQKAVINNLVIQYNYLPVIERYTKTVQLVDTTSISKYGLALLRIFQFQGVFVGKHSIADVQSYFDQIRDRYSAPPLRLKIEVMPEWDLLDVGDSVRVDLEYVRDYNQDSTLSRTFEIQQIRNNWKTGIVSLDLFGGIERSSKESLSTAAVMNDSFYTAKGTELSTVLTISAGVVTANGTLTGDVLDHENAVYYYDGDLTISSGVTVTIEDNVQLRIKGFLTINGSIDGSGQGYAGAAATGTRFGAVGTQGLVGISRTYPGVDIDRRSGIWGQLSPIFRKESNRYSSGPGLNSFNGLNIINPDGLSLEGLPPNLQGTAGASGHGAAEDRSYRAPGGAGGAGGAGLVVIARGVAIGGSGDINLSGGDGASPSSFEESTTAFDFICYAGAGQGGFPGGVIFMLDGDVEAPFPSSIICEAGATPIPSVDVALPTTKERDEFFTNATCCWYKPFDAAAAWDFSDSVVGIYYINAAVNGYVWTNADEIAETGDLGFVLV